MTTYLYMDGVDDYLFVPVITSDAIEIELLQSSNNMFSDELYYFDGRETSSYDYFVYSGTYNRGHGARVASVYVNGSLISDDSIDFIDQSPKDQKFLLRTEKDTYGTDGADSGNYYIFSHAGGSGTLEGNLYDIKIYNNGTLVAHYDMSTGTVQDQSGNGNDATLYGGTWKTTDTGPTPIDSGPITLSASGAQSAQSTRIRSAQASMAGDGGLTAQPIRGLHGASDLLAISDMQTQALRIINDSAALQGTSTLTAQAGNVTIITGSANLSAVGSVAAKAQRIVHERVDMQGASDLSASPTRLISSTTDLHGVSDLSAQATAIIAIDADLVAQGAMQAVIGAELVGTIELTGQRELHVYLVGKRELNVNLKGVI